ncbi:hypothetical protein D5086_002329 [Populus alba]|uniref:Uncharacterized protein n=5 Tax=Populus TaxID=3689 RepID=A0ACC4D1S8_POPAL|nr:uncharacterized protein LOC118032935 [Populus alba]KAJ7012852.1 hypothetical protein NC653_002785 [Populus alba x Populus x berolinensis]TKS16195.1 hypothetical protein D5086_0000024880 [Populus alba]
MAVTKEELEFLETRKLLKEQIRKRNCSHHLSELSNSDHHKTKTYGSFFGSSQSSIAPRVIQESKSKLQTQIPQHRAVSADTLLSAMDNRTKVQRLRQTRDYSFLFSDDNNDLTPPVSSATPAQASVPSTKHYADVKGLRKFNDPKLKPKQPALACSLKPLTNKGVMEKITSRMSLQYPCTDKRKPIVKAVHPTKQFAGSNDSKGPQRPNDPTLNPKQPVKPHEMTNKRARGNISSPVSNLQDHRPKKRRLSDEVDDCEGEKALLIIRKMFNTKRFAGRDDRDIKMEASFGDITKEEKRSERLGRKEDREQLRLLEKKTRGVRG